MEQELLHKMFAGEATDAEIARIRKWADASQENKERLFRERAFFDALRLSAPISEDSENSKRRSLVRWQQWLVGAAAVVIALFVLHLTVPSVWDEKAGKPIVYNTVRVPSGQCVELVLADGTHVWLNAHSELAYPTSFNGETREVQLKGEAFFDVAKDKSKRFIVDAGRCEIEVLGTSFNVEAYNEEEFTTALLQGSLKVTDSSNPEKSVVLKPNNEVRLSDGQLEISPITDFTPYSWRKGLIIFKNTRFKDLMKKLEKSYGIQITVENPQLENYACSGKFRISDGVEEVLRVLQQDAKFSFERENENQITIR